MIFLKGVTLVSDGNFGRYLPQDVKFKNKHYMSFKKSSMCKENSKKPVLALLKIEGH